MPYGLKSNTRSTRRHILLAPAPQLNRPQASSSSDNVSTRTSSKREHSSLHPESSENVPVNSIPKASSTVKRRYKVVEVNPSSRNPSVRHHIKEVSVEGLRTAASAVDQSIPTHCRDHDGSQAIVDDDGDPAWRIVDEQQRQSSDEAETHSTTGTKRRDKTTHKWDPLASFLPFRDHILREMTRHDGLKDLCVRSSGYPACSRCQEEDGSLKCTDCLHHGLYCADCMCEIHQVLPLHHIQIYNGKFFQPYELQRTGLVVQLGHDGAGCPNPSTQGHLLTVIDVSGIHRVAYALCACGRVGAVDSYIQLLRHGWWPSSIVRPRTATTINALQFFHAIAIQGKVSVNAFYNGIVRVTDSAGILPVKTCYKQFNLAARTFKNLRFVKRGGVAQDPGGVANIVPGSLGLSCPACPDTRRNLPAMYKQLPEELQYLYRLHLSIDANFKLTHKSRGSRLQSTYLADGWSFMVEREPYREHLANITDDIPEIKYCDSDHAAIRHANVLSSKRWAINGIGAVVCARHLLYRSQGVVDLPRGERFACMDYAVVSTTAATARGIMRVLYVYDIACSWGVHLLERWKADYNAIYELPDDAEVTFAIPKFHIEAHGPDCKARFNLNNTHGAGRTCGEGIESGWSDLNPIGVFTREQSAAYRQECIDDLMQAMNFRKMKSMGSFLLRQLKEALPFAAIQHKRFMAFQSTVDSARVAAWEQAISVWNSTKDKKRAHCPYSIPVETQTLTAVRNEIAAAEAEELAKGINLNEMTAGVYIASVIALEDQQYALNLKEKAGSSPSDREEASLQVKFNQLRSRMQSLERVQAAYILGLEMTTPADMYEDDASPAPVLQTLVAESNKWASTPRRIVSDDDEDSEWTNVQPITPLTYKPYTSKARKAREKYYAPHASHPKLWLPSNVPVNLHKTHCLAGIVEKEIRIRIAICSDSMSNIKSTLRSMYSFRLANKSAGYVTQSHQTRNQTTRKSMRAALNRHVARYRRSFLALQALDPFRTFDGGKWQYEYRVLKEADLASPAGDDVETLEDPTPDELAAVGSEKPQRGPSAKKKISEGRKGLSWIWQVGNAVTGDDVDDERMYAHVRADWVRLRARALRWREQIPLLLEEMRRTVTSFMFTAAEWKSRGEGVEAAFCSSPEDIRRGLIAHANRQSNVYEAMAISCVRLWAPWLHKHDLAVVWPASLISHAELVVKLADAAINDRGPAKTGKAAVRDDSVGIDSCEIPDDSGGEDSDGDVGVADVDDEGDAEQREQLQNTLYTSDEGED